MALLTAVLDGIAASQLRAAERKGAVRRAVELAMAADPGQHKGGEPGASDAEDFTAMRRQALGIRAQKLIGASSELVSVIGAKTLAKGVADLRSAGKGPRSHMERDWRALDTAGALLRHPGCGEEILDQAKGWLEQVGQLPPGARLGEAKRLEVEHDDIGSEVITTDGDSECMVRSTPDGDAKFEGVDTAEHFVIAGDGESPVECIVNS